MEDPTCPVCGADILLNGDELTGDYAFCSYCEVELRLRREPQRWEAEMAD
jgi:hypothetical protein